VYQWAFDLKQVSDGFLAMLLGRPFTTIPGA
jgi:hypothetical protein